jgi:thymidylate synthase ThyX
MVQTTPFPRRVYPLDAQALTEEQIAVAFAMTSRNAAPFDEIARQVSAEKAAEFNERWVLGYGHASVAEHAILHIAVEGYSRLVVDTLEDNRLASYTEQSSRYQVLKPGYYHTPAELDKHPSLRAQYQQTCDRLFTAYHDLLDKTQAHLRTVKPRGENEREAAYNLRIRREATDACRFILPAATLTNVGVTMNARALEHAIRKLLASPLQEERDLGEQVKAHGREVTPTLIKYADPTDYLRNVAVARSRARPNTPAEAHAASEARLVDYDRDAEVKVIAALLFATSHQAYVTCLAEARAMPPERRAAVLQHTWGAMGPFDVPWREAEMPYYTFEFDMDYGAYREFKRHRMQTYIPQPLSTLHGALVPALVRDAGLADAFRAHIVESDTLHARLAAELPDAPAVAQYAVTHAHRRRVLAQLNLREAYHLFRLRTGPQAHPTLREVMQQALDQCRAVHPGLFAHFKARDR